MYEAKPMTCDAFLHATRGGREGARRMHLAIPVRVEVGVLEGVCLQDIWDAVSIDIDP